MKIPTVTDEMLGAVLESAMSPVCIVWTLAGNATSIDNFYRATVVAEEFDDKIIFLRVWIDENETAHWNYGPSEDGRPTWGFSIYKRRQLAGVQTRFTPIEDLRRALDEAMGRAA